MKNIFTILLVISFVGIAVFGLFPFSHHNYISQGPMINCPHSENGSAVCSNTFYHINNWQHFLNVVVPSLFIFLFLAFGIVLFFFNKQNLLNQKRYFHKWKYYLDNKKLFTYREKIIKWLSLFENSPSLSYVRHS